MARLAFAPALRRHADAPPASLPAARLRDLLDAYFERHPRVRGYVLDDQGALRHHVAVFIDGVPAGDRTGLGDALADDADVQVFQALSGG